MLLLDKIQLSLVIILALITSVLLNPVQFAEAKDLIIDESCDDKNNWNIIIAGEQGKPLENVRIGTIEKFSASSLEESFYTDKNGFASIPPSSNTGFVKISKGGYNEEKLSTQCNSFNGNAPIDSFVTYNNPTYGIKLEYPGTWMITEDIADKSLKAKFTLAEHGFGKSHTGLELLVFDLPYPVSNEEQAGKTY